MIRLNIVVEGQTEESFVRDVLAPHLATLEIWVRARCAQTGRKRGIVFRGGIVSYTKLRRDLALWMSEDHKPEAYFSTMVDLYRLPVDFPGYETASKITEVQSRAVALEKSFREDVAHPRGHFIPHVQPYEFEALLLARPDLFARRFPGREKAVSSLCRLVESFGCPECVNDDEPPRSASCPCCPTTTSWPMARLSQRRLVCPPCGRSARILAGGSGSSKGSGETFEA